MRLLIISGKGYKMNKKKIIILVTVIVAVFTALVFGYKFLDSVSYTEEKIKEIKNSEEVIVLREYEGLMGDGVRVYYKRPFGRKIFLGRVSCDDGVKFSYSCHVYNDCVTISYKYRHNDYRERTFEYPEKKWYEKIFD